MTDKKTDERTPYPDSLLRQRPAVLWKRRDPGFALRSPNPRSAPRSAPRTPIFGRCRIPLCEADCGDGGALTTYSPYPCAQRRLSSLRVVPVTALLQPSRVAALAGSSARPNSPPPSLPLWWFSLPRPRLAAPVGCGSASRFRADSRQARHNGSRWP